MRRTSDGAARERQFARNRAFDLWAQIWYITALEGHFGDSFFGSAPRMLGGC
jgi:hypothetical protein